ncbi:TRAP transporter fused permease subunit [Azospirillum sp. RWY-5-1]|uniref:TRAP transporter fused permease subunit n=1 Tax=Azospirillum oleiclasticum TaxID=2735135 RepID=A0ABX2T6A9_9PROT|nr:TRAP transporter fused permease subunit [Azospirillum oleiclasticum]NYZ12551.1 TRAP transporter fused permease subunit [Azospirillum oleiclasticum]NYZ19711.1 TRAP transporter fused permease subunit [Azospirillum oleiclasticum]
MTEATAGGASLPERAALRHAGLVLAAAVTVGAHVWLIVSGLVPNLISRPLHLLVSLPWIFLFAAPRGAASKVGGWVACGLGMAGCLYIMLNRSAIVDQYGSLDGSLFQYGLSAVLILVVLEMARRAVQPVLPVVALLVLAYGLFGDLLPGSLGHGGMPVDYFLGNLVLAEAGLWGMLTGTSIDLIVPFMILGAFVSAGEAGTGFMAVATQLAGRFQAGAAKVAVLGSALYGTISGSASANVASVGTITIPAMKRMGYPPAFAAATEAVASTGGQIMPPVMGAGAFIMAELLRVPYTDIAVAAVLPAVLFFAAAWTGIHFFARRYDLAGIPASELPGWAAVARAAPFFLAPLVVLIITMMVLDHSPAWSALAATAVTIAALGLDASLGHSVRRWWVRAQAGLIDAARQIAFIAAILICAGIIVGVFNATGLGVKITSLIVSLSGDRLWVALLLTATACLVLGMELPTTAAYLICIAVAGPALTQLGLPELHGHMFVFWYALLCTITPPVCGTVFVAAGIAGAPWLTVAAHAMRIGIGLYIIPLAMVANPALLLLGTTPLLAVLAAVKVMAGTVLVSHATIGGASHPLTGAASLVGGLVLLFTFGVGA